MDVTETSFEHDVIERSKEVPVVVDFWADWCGPCGALKPALKAAVDDRNGELELAMVNVDEHPNLSSRYKVLGIPAVKVFRDGKMIAEFMGSRPRAKIDAFLAAALALAPVGPVQTGYDRLLEQLHESKRHPGVLEALQLGYNDQALTQLLDELQKSSEGPERDELRRMMLVIFEHLGNNHPMSQRFRRKTAAALF
ncbi:MAG: tetratricopeptide repeat protein [Thermoleophilia bacterium]|nr:tetratricopeptide repeat protein [Thermoleophilia bacterium]